MMVWWNVWIYCNLNLCVAVVELGPKSSAVQTSHRFNYIQGGTLLQRFSIFGKNVQFTTYRSFSVYLGQPVSAINWNFCWISGAWTFEVESLYRINLVTGHVVICMWYCPTKCDGGDFAQMFGLLTYCCVTGWVRAGVDQPITLPAMRQSITLV